MGPLCRMYRIPDGFLSLVIIIKGNSLKVNYTIAYCCNHIGSLYVCGIAELCKMSSLSLKVKQEKSDNIQCTSWQHKDNADENLFFHSIK